MDDDDGEEEGMLRYLWVACGSICSQGFRPPDANLSGQLHYWR